MHLRIDGTRGTVCFLDSTNYIAGLRRGGVTCQKSPHVFSNGPCAAMYRFVTPLAGISICQNNDVHDDDEEDNKDDNDY